MDRCDREVRGGTWHRRHSIDACQLLDLARTFKYEQGSVEQLATLAARCRNQASARMRLFSWLVFNVLVGHSDSHLKNLSFLVSHEGVQLAPFYDLVSIAADGAPAYQKSDWPTRASFAWDILGVRHHDDFDRALMLAAGETLGLGRRTAELLLDTLAGSIVKTAAALYERIERENAQWMNERAELAVTFGGERACLRMIRYAIIGNMARKFAAS